MSKASVKEAMELAGLSSDCSYLLTHLVRQNDGKTDDEAKDILSSILGVSTGNRPKLIASNTGYYGDLYACVLRPSKKTYSIPSNKKSVCFTESTLTGLLAHRKVYNAKYGLSFTRAHLYSEGANPVINITEKYMKEIVGSVSGGYDKVYNHIPEPLTPFVNIVNDNFDATHEREWRVSRDLEFERENIIFIFCPYRDFHHFSHFQKNGLPILFDLNWLQWV